jgi:hypothetical protein
MKKIFFILTLSLLAGGCAHTHYVFENAAPIMDAGDKNPSPVPARSDFDLHEYMVSSAVRYPVVKSLDVRRIPRSEDVNSLDELPQSSWYTPRLGYQSITPRELLKGPEDKGAPQGTLTVLKVKSKGTAPGFVIQDSRGVRYLFKLDDRDHPGLESSINFVANRLFWGFGYNVPEDYIVYFTKDDLKLNSDLTEEDIDSVLRKTTRLAKGRYRVTASRMIDGEVLGYVSQVGTRKGDINDTIPHEERRILRALYVFGALTQHTGMRSDNTLEVYQGEPGAGYTTHYLLDFGETFGVHGLSYGRNWEGYEHYFSWNESAVNLAKLGIQNEPWRDLDPSGDIRTYYEAEEFDPSKWKEIYQFQPIRRSQADDNYWAAKVIGAVTREHLETLFEATAHIDQDEVDYLIDTFMKRRTKLLEYHLYQVSPLESKGVVGNELIIEDMGKKLLGVNELTSYSVAFFDKNNGKLGENLYLENSASSVTIPLPARNGYLRVEVSVAANGQEPSRPAEFHLRANDSDGYQLVGIVH